MKGRKSNAVSGAPVDGGSRGKGRIERNKYCEWKERKDDKYFVIVVNKQEIPFIISTLLSLLIQRFFIDNAEKKEEDGINFLSIFLFGSLLRFYNHDKWSIQRSSFFLLIFLSFFPLIIMKNESRFFSATHHLLNSEILFLSIHFRFSFFNLHLYRWK